MFTGSKSHPALVNITSTPRTGSEWQFANYRTLAERFWAKVQLAAPDVCWLWSASTTGSGGLVYGQFVLPRTRDGRQIHLYAHRLAWMLTHGAIPDGLNVCHHCDVPRCCNPSHLFLGTQADNLADCRAKGRARPRGRLLPAVQRHGDSLRAPSAADQPQSGSGRHLIGNALAGGVS